MEPSLIVVAPQPRLLVVEDNFLMAQVICDFARDCGFEPVGPACDLDAGLDLACGERIDGAVLDINLHGLTCFPICSVLARRAVPFLFLSGYSPGAIIPNEYRAAAHVEKPFIAEHFREELELLLGGARSSADADGTLSPLHLRRTAGHC
jgi:DNA-binding response OmpR family regulator